MNYKIVEKFINNLGIYIGFIAGRHKYIRHIKYTDNGYASINLIAYVSINGNVEFHLEKNNARYENEALLQEHIDKFIQAKIVQEV